MTHVIIERLSYRLRQLHLGFKDKHTARTYNITVNHRRRIISSTTGHPARFNDKTLILFDTFAQNLRSGGYNDKFNFELFDYGDDGEVVTVKYCGCYLIVDNGYMNCSVAVPPTKPNKTTPIA